MLQSLTDVNFICGDPKFFDGSPVKPFDKYICNFISSLSELLFHSQDARKYPEIIAFAFFCRKSNLANCQNSYKGVISSRLGRGISFHIAPSNVPVNFAYSLVVGLLSGNTCVVKAPSKKFDQVNVICNALNKLLDTPEYERMKSYILIVEYSRENQRVTEYFSSLCDLRVIWGGDDTVNNVRGATISPKSYDITFADRYSLCLIDAETVLNCSEAKMDDLSNKFYNDTYLFDQNACTSPSLIYWVGDKKKVNNAQKVFWDHIEKIVAIKYSMESLIAVNKLTTIYKAAIAINGLKVICTDDNRICRIELSSLDKSIPEYRCAGGIFFEFQSTDMKNLSSIVTSKYQTVTYFGLNPDEIKNYVLEAGLKGIDRVVPIGKAADFNLVWDGYDLISMMSRMVWSE